MSKIKLGVIGVGHMGNYHARICNMLRDHIDFVGVCDIRKKRADFIADKYNTTAYYDYKKLLKKVDAVNIAVSTDEHFRVAKGCLNAGVDILLEKPMTDNLNEAKKLIEIAKRKNLSFHVGHVERFNSAVVELMKFSHDLKPISLRAKRLGPQGDKIRHSGVILDLMIHDIDIMLNIMESKVVDISAYGKKVYTDYEDIANVQLLFENGSFATVSASRITQKKIRTLDLTMPDKYIYLDYSDEDIYIYRRGKSKDSDDSKIRKVIDTNVEKILIEKNNPLKLEIKHFINAVKGKEKSQFTPEQNLKSLEIVLNAERKAKKYWDQT
ncbi:MAG: Gfo/Idh/MocA family oxidoreductase [Candidatus Mcinerneyibacterium aminivorans]|uniref:Gfo/Idh/MocA family oxidoreductase n=1 Tax=Candidatus Mcinerneyibacterium aminivorans TaxID=2703815 RepID=A0A5D0MMR4_9BACT|nr:MAG: Gfo/Idh/MocA family oxidoreductase [Candidatus Mcinerneyibacterium aminivorans]